MPDYAFSVTTQQTYLVSASITLKVTLYLNLNLWNGFIKFMALFAVNVKVLLGTWLLCPLHGLQWDQLLILPKMWWFLSVIGNV